MNKFLRLLLICTLLIGCKAQKQDKKKKELSDSLMVGEYLITSNGIYLDSILTKIPDSLGLIADKSLTGDFNGDNKMDFASIVKNKKNKKTGVLILHNFDNKESFVFGAGKEVDRMTDLDWIEVFETLPKGDIVSPTLVDEKTGDIIGQDENQNFKLIGNAIYMSVEESHGGGIIFWNGKEYKWYHIE